MEFGFKMKGKQMKNLPLKGLKTQPIVLFLAVSLGLCAIMSCPAAAQDEQSPGTITSEPMNKETGAAETTETPADANSAQRPAARPQAFGPLQIFLIVVMVIIVFMMFRGPRKKQAEHRKMMQSLKKNDRVRTIGGIYGTVVDVRDDEIVLKIDESNNTKMKISPNAIGTKLSEKES